MRDHRPRCQALDEAERNRAFRPCLRKFLRETLDPVDDAPDERGGAFAPVDRDRARKRHAPVASADRDVNRAGKRVEGLNPAAKKSGLRALTHTILLASPKLCREVALLTTAPISRELLLHYQNRDVAHGPSL